MWFVTMTLEPLYLSEFQTCKLSDLSNFQTPTPSNSPTPKLNIFKLSKLKQWLAHELSHVFQLWKLQVLNFESLRVWKLEGRGYSVLWCSMLYHCILCCSVMYYDVLLCSMWCFIVFWYIMVSSNVLWCLVVSYAVSWRCMVYYGVLWCYVVLGCVIGIYGVLWCIISYDGVLWISNFQSSTWCVLYMLFCNC